MTDHRKCDHAEPPDQMSEPCQRFFSGQDQLVHFLVFTFTLAQRNDDVAKIARETLRAVDDPSDGVEVPPAPSTANQHTEYSAVDEFRSHGQLLLEMMLCRGIDNYLCYLSELLFELFRIRPETLKSGERLKTQDVLSHSTMEDLIHALAERRVQRLAYAGLRELAAYADERLGIPLFDDEHSLARAVRIVELRNIVVHNRGVINNVFLSRVTDSEWELGTHPQLWSPFLMDELDFLAKSVAALDNAVAKKFGVPQSVSRTPPPDQSTASD